MTKHSDHSVFDDLSFDNSNASLDKFTGDWPFATWQMTAPVSATLAMPRQVVFGISTADKKTKLAVMLQPCEAQDIANTLAKAAEAAIVLMLMEGQAQ